MHRRRFVLLAGATSLGGLAGCGSVFETESVGRPPVVEARPDAVYIPSHVEGMETIGTRTAGDRTVALMYTYAHRFWTLLNNNRQRVRIGDEADVHLMASVWDTATQHVLPVDAGLEMEIRKDGSPLLERVPWPMLAQPMGFHLGDNIPLEGEGTYEVRVTATALGGRRGSPVTLAGDFAGRFEPSETVSFTFEYSEAEKRSIPIKRFPDRQGEPGAIEPMMDMPLSRAPAAADLPGQPIGEASSGDAVFIATAEERADDTYLAVSPRTPYNRYVIPMLSLSATLTREGSTIAEDRLQPALDPERNYHYGLSVPGVQSGDELILSVETPSQVARHEGYEMAFIDMPSMTFAVQ